MREILFKAKRIDNGEWVEGSFIDSGNHSQVFIFPPYEGASIFPCRTLVYHEMVAVDSDTICQYTGLTDKNGRKIWENDICDRGESYPEIVRYHEGDYVLDYSYAYGKEYGHDYCNLGFYVCERSGVEVIGNVFDNPELLKKAR